MKIKLPRSILALMPLILVGTLYAQPAAAIQKQSKSVSNVWDFLSQKYDKDRNGQLTTEEYDRNAETFAKFDTNKDGVLTVDDWEQGSARSNRRRGSGGRKNGARSAPKVGQVAPDFELAYVSQPEKTVKLSSYATNKPVALIFGSCT